MFLNYFLWYSNKWFLLRSFYVDNEVRENNVWFVWVLKNVKIIDIRNIF